MQILVVGSDRVDAGKTTFSTGLVAATGGVGFKPRAGNDLWFDHDDYRHALDAGKLYGKDARRLRDACRTDHSLEALNPIHRLWRPSPGGGRGLIGPADRQFVLDRVGDEYVVNETADVPPSARESLPLEGARTVSSLPELNDVMRERHLPELDRVTTRIERAERAVVESYEDVALPVTGVEFDAVAVVEPGRVRVYDGDRYARAREVASGGSHPGKLEERVADVVAPLTPVETVSLPALSKDVRTAPTRVSDAYADAYDALLSVAAE